MTISEVKKLYASYLFIIFEAKYNAVFFLMRMVTISHQNYVNVRQPGKVITP
jgi:hypothetical protein